MSAGLVAVVIPALDEAEAIGDVVRGVVEAGVPLVIVADNGSTDRTASVAEAAGAVVVSEPRRGYGYACAAGSAAALDRGASVLVFFDGDGSSRATEIEQLVAPLRNGSADLVLGSRLLEASEIAAGAMPPHQRFGNWLTARMMRLRFDVDVTDLGPFRAISRELFERIEMSEMTFGWPTEMMVAAARHDAVVIEVPVSWDNRAAGRSKVSGTVKGSVLAAWHILRITLGRARGVS